MNGYTNAPTTSSKESQFQQACIQLDAQMASLEKTIGVLNERLSMIRCEMPRENSKDCHSISPMKSSLVSYIDLKIEQVRKLEAFCHNIINEIQI